MDAAGTERELNQERLPDCWIVGYFVKEPNFNEKV